MLEEKRKPHIVFQVLNFISSDSSLNNQLLPVDRLLLIMLAKHHGTKGIYPSTTTLSDELRVSPTYVKLRIAHLEKLKIIEVVRKSGKSNHYNLTVLSTDQSTTVDQSIGVDQSTTVDDTGQLQCWDRSTTVDTISINNQQSGNSTERGRKKRALPLADDFQPDKIAINTAKQAGLTEEEANLEFEIFMNHHQGKGTEMVDWQKVLANWFIRGGKYKREAQAKGKFPPKQEVRSTVPWYTPESSKVNRRGNN